MRAEDVEILIVPGLGNSGPDHWQSRWQNRLKTARRVEQSDWDTPDRDGWSARVLAAITAARKPVVLVAHGLGVVAAVNAAASETDRVAGAFLVAPPDLEDPAVSPFHLDRFGSLPRSALPFPSFLVASRNDPYCSFARAEALATSWRSLLLDAGPAGHLDETSGRGPWPEGLLLFARLLRSTGTRD